VDLGEMARAAATGGCRAAAPSRSSRASQLGGLEGSLTYRMTQVLTGHGVFGEYLHRIQREVTAICHHCKEEKDTAQHTLEFCPAWAEPRRVLRLAIGERLAPEAIVEAVMRGPQELAAVRAFCEQVMLVKERAERSREKRGDPVRMVRRRGRELLRRRGAAAPPPPPSPT
jgi:hypothetical protein